MWIVSRVKLASIRKEKLYYFFLFCSFFLFYYISFRCTGETVFDWNKIDHSIGMTIRAFWNMILDKGQGQRNLILRKSMAQGSQILLERKHWKKRMIHPLDRFLVDSISLLSDSRIMRQTFAHGVSSWVDDLTKRAILSVGLAFSTLYTNNPDIYFIDGGVFAGKLWQKIWNSV